MNNSQIDNKGSGTTNIELWNVSMRQHIFDRFTVNRLNGNTFNDCPDEDMIVWREVSSEISDKLTVLDMEMEITTPIDAWIVHPKMLRILQILERGIITKQEWDYLGL